jgi:hypothetical protein
LLSRISYGSFLCYAPEGTSERAAAAKVVVAAIKADLYVGESIRVIPHAIARLREQLTPELRDLLSLDALLVPAPKSAPFRPGTKDYLWVPNRICEELLAQGFGERMEPLLVRVKAVRKSATSQAAERATPEEHYRSLRVKQRLRFSEPSEIVVVDDIITRGATLLAGVSILQEAFPAAKVRGFALVRSAFPDAFGEIVDPFYGSVHTAADGKTWKEPS